MPSVLGSVEGTADKFSAGTVSTTSHNFLRSFSIALINSDSKTNKLGGLGVFRI